MTTLLFGFFHVSLSIFPLFCSIDLTCFRIVFIWCRHFKAHQNTWIKQLQTSKHPKLIGSNISADKNKSFNETDIAFYQCRFLIYWMNAKTHPISSCMRNRQKRIRWIFKRIQTFIVHCFVKKKIGPTLSNISHKRT